MEDRLKTASGYQLDNICLQVNVAIQNDEGEYIDAKNWYDKYGHPPITKRSLVKYTINSSQKQFTAFRLHSQIPNYTALIFQNGSMMIVGVKDKNQIAACVEQTARQLADAISRNIILSRVQTVNIVVSFSFPPLNFSNLQCFFKNNSVPFIHNPHTFPGLFLKVMIPKHSILNNQSIFDFYNTHRRVQDYRMITVLLFQVGKVVLLGTQGEQDWHVAHKMLTALFREVSAFSFNNNYYWGNKIKVKCLDSEIKLFYYYDGDEDDDYDFSLETLVENGASGFSPTLDWFTQVCFLLGGKRDTSSRVNSTVVSATKDYDSGKMYQELGVNFTDHFHRLNKAIATITYQ